MIGFRGGARQTLCDGCYRPKPAGEEGWVKVKVKRAYRPPDDVVVNRPSSVTVGVDEDRCPSCAGKL